MGETGEGNRPPQRAHEISANAGGGFTGQVSYSLHLTFSLNKFTNFLCHQPFIDGMNR
jgi:hypothetical protein